MSALVPILAGLGASLLALLAGISWGRRAEARRSDVALEDLRLDTERDLAARDADVRRLASEVATLRSNAAISLVTGLPADGAPDRPTARALERFPARLRGLASIDDAIVVGPDGMPATPCDDQVLIRASTLVADLGPLLARRLPGFIGLTVELRGRDPITYRRLPDWTSGAWLVVAGRGGPANSQALDTAIVGAFRAQRDTPHGGALTGRRAGGHPADEGLLSPDIAGAFRAAALVVGGELTAYGCIDGPERASMVYMVPGLVALGQRVRHWCGEPLALRLENARGEWVVTSPVDERRHLVVVGTGPTFDELAFERLRGRVRRISVPNDETIEAADHAIVEEHAS